MRTVGSCSRTGIVGTDMNDEVAPLRGGGIYGVGRESTGEPRLAGTRSLPPTAVLCTVSDRFTLSAALDRCASPTNVGRWLEHRFIGTEETFTVKVDQMAGVVCTPNVSLPGNVLQIFTQFDARRQAGDKYKAS